MQHCPPLRPAALTLVLPTFTTSAPGPTFTAGQLAFAAIASLALYLLFVFVQTVRHRDYFIHEAGDEDEHARTSGNCHRGDELDSASGVPGGRGRPGEDPSPNIESAVIGAGLPIAFVGVVIAMVVLLPEGIAAVRAARIGRVQTSLNLAFGSAMASIGPDHPDDRDRPDLAARNWCSGWARCRSHCW